VTPQGEIPPTGRRSVRVDFADIFELNGDRFGQHRVYFDTMALMAQLGAPPAVPA
jgi:predicted ester cyclase